MKFPAAFRSRLQIKLVLIVAAMFGFVLIASTVILMMSLTKLGQMSIERQLNEELTIIDRRFAELVSSLQQAAVLVSRKPLILRGLAENDQPLIEQELPITTAALNHDFAWVIDSQGMIIGSTAGNNGKQVDIELLLSSGEFSYENSPVTKGMVWDSLYLILAIVPVYDTQAQFLGLVVVANVIDGELLGRLNSFRDTLALAIFGLDTSVKGINANEENGQPHLDETETESLRLDESMWEQIQRGETLYQFNVSVRGTPHALFYRPLFIQDQVFGYYVVAIDENEPRALQNNVLIISLGTVFLVLILTGFLITVSLRQFVIHPLRILSHAANQLGAGQLDARVQTKSTDEIGQLYSTFNTMAAHIETRTQELNSLNHALETRVIERTAQIERQTIWLEAIVCSAQEAIIVTDQEGSVRLINDAALKTIGMKELDALDVSLSELIAGTAQQTINLPTGTDEARGELEISGHFYFYSITAIHPQDTEISGYVCILSDVTTLYRLNELKTQIIRLASHDLRSPLTALRLQHYLFKRHQGNLNDIQQDILNRMENNISDMQAMIDDLLNLDYIEHQAQGKRDAVSLNILVESAVSLLTPQAKIKNQHIETEIIGDIPHICGDPVRLLEAIRNYLTNAIKYTPSGGTIHACVYADKQEVYIKIRDNGIGIDAKDLDQVFEPRFRAQTALTTKEEGEGIGLSLVKAVIHEHGGRVWATSAPGMGSTFGFSLPIDQSYLV